MEKWRAERIRKNLFFIFLHMKNNGKYFLSMDSYDVIYGETLGIYFLNVFFHIDKMKQFSSPKLRKKFKEFLESEYPDEKDDIFLIIK